MTLVNDYLLGDEIKVNDDVIIFQDDDKSKEIGVFINNKTRCHEILETSKKERDSPLYLYNRNYNQSVRNDARKNKQNKYSLSCTKR